MENYFTPYDFSHSNRLQRKIYKELWNETTKYIYAQNEQAAIRMVLFKYNGHQDLYYCVNKRGYSVVPKLVETKEGETVIHGKYTIEMKENASLKFFMDNLDKDDTVITHKIIYKPNYISDEEMIIKLQEYLDADKNN